MRTRPLPRAAALAAAAGFSALLSAPNSTPAAPVDFGGHSYDLIGDGQISWTGALDAAEDAGGSLATITSASEQAFIESLLVDRTAPSGSYWFGLQETSEGVYSPIGGETSSYNNFPNGEPNNLGPGETVGSIYWSADESVPTFFRRGQWNDLPDGGYPDVTTPNPDLPDLIRAGYIVEFATPVGSPGGGNGGGDGNGNGGGGDGNGGGGTDGDGDGGGGTGGGGNGNGGNGGGSGGGDGGTVIPIPSALLAFPATALLAYAAARRMRRQ